MTAALDVLTRDNRTIGSKQAIGQAKRGATLAAIDDAIWIVLDRRDVLCADVTRIDPHGGDAGGAKAVFRGEFVARWLMPGARRSLFAAATSR